MGDLQSKPIQNHELRHLEEQYQPFSKGKLMPGEPVYLKLNSIFQKSDYSDRNSNRFRKVERYQIFRRYTETSLQEDRGIYDFRRTNLPCIVQVVYYCIDKEDCECSNNAYRMTLFTEHVETRLAHYKTTKKVQNNQQQSIQYYHPFTLDEGIYVLINALHAYELLSQQFSVNYPSAFSIGINYKAQVKVWLNDNWSINDQNQRKLSENYIIEEIVNIIEERMEGNFNEILNVTANYMNFTFAVIQDVLSRFTINYQRGKKSLEDRFNNRSFINDGDKSNIFSQKFPIGRQRFNSLQTVSNGGNILTVPSSTQPPDATKSTQNSRGDNEKRYVSQQSNKKTNPIIIANSTRNFSNTPRTSIEESPKKVIKFTYQQSPSLMKQSPKVSTMQRHSSPISSFNQTIKFTPPPPQIYSYALINHQSKSLIQQTGQQGGRPLMMPSNVTSQFLDKNVISSLIDKKIKAQNQPVMNDSSNKGMMGYSGFKRQTPTPVKPIYNSLQQNLNYFDSKPKQVIIKPFEIAHQQEKNVQIEYSSQKIKKKSSKQLNNTASGTMSLSEITEQFKNLLKSEHRMEERQQLFYNYEEQQPFSTQRQEQKDCRRTIQESHDNNPYINSFYQIKEEDEDVSYSIDQLI